MQKTIQDQPKPQVRFSFDLDRALHKQLKLAAIEKEKKATELVREAIRLYLAA